MPVSPTLPLPAGKILVIGFALLCHAAWCPSASAQAVAETPTPESGPAKAAPGFAVVELFTSQGCSSCPPADDLLVTIAELAEKKRLPVYALSMHVDYWNSLGWADPFSAARFTQRQQAYARVAGSRRVYTPQMIVNGDALGFTGSNRAAAGRAIRGALQGPPATRVTIDAAATDTPGAYRVSYRVANARPGDRLVACLVQDAPPQDVTRGENAGRRLSHVGVVRAMELQPLELAPNAAGRAASGRLTIAAPAGTDAPAALRAGTPLSIVAFVQDPRTMAIRGAARWANETEPGA
ncbi:MAG: DUF1223 domain-containing protein [Planctomycetota bacterium]